MSKVLICLADGFEEIEAVTPIDLLRRAGIDVIIAGVGDDVITGSRGISIVPNGPIEELKDETYDGIILPGGMPGATNLAASWEVNEILISMLNEGKLVAAICAAPAAVLGKAGLIEGRRATCYPGAETFAPEARFVKESLVMDGNLITASGPGLAADFAFAIIEYLISKEKSEEVKAGALF